MLAAHPHMHSVPGQPKELHFFDRYWNREFTREDGERYASYFPRPVGTLVGEWTPRYLLDPWVPELLHQAAPDVKVLVLLRDPIERYRSGLSHDLHNGAPANPVLASDAVNRGLYHRQLTNLYRFFPPEQVLVLQYERCCKDPRTQLRRTYEFLGLDPSDFVPADVEETFNGSRVTKATLPTHIRSTLRSLYEDDVAALAPLCPTLDLALWPNFAHLATAPKRPANTCA